MLYLDPPFPIIDGVSFFPNHVNKRDWYFLAIGPQLATSPDPISGLAIPQLSVIEFRGRAGNGGIVNFDVTCGIDDDRLTELAPALARMMDLDEEPVLSPVPLKEATVKMQLFDLESGQTAGTGEGLRFVKQISHDAHAAGYGDNRAAISVQLTQEGMTAFRRAMQGELMPIGVVYTLSFLALRPAYSVSLHVDWDRVQERLDTTFGGSFLFSSVEISEAVDKLIDDRVIDLRADTFVPEGEDEQAVIGRRDLALAQVHDMITDAFFEPSINPTTAAADGWEKLEHLARTASMLAVTGGWGAVGSFTYKNTHYTRIDAKTLNTTMSERTTVERRVFPQKHLDGLFSLLQNPDFDMSRIVTQVDLDDPWFERRRVKVIPRADWERDKLASINVTLDYADRAPQSVVLDEASAPTEVDWASEVDGDGRLDPRVTATFTVNFADVDVTERPRSLTSEPREVTVESLEVFPRDLYSIIPLPIRTLGTMRWDRFPRVEVEIRHGEPDRGIDIDDIVILDAQHPDAIYDLFVTAGASPAWSYRLCYRAADHRDVNIPWQVGGEEISIADPFPSSLRRSLEVVPAFNWSSVERAFVDVVYEDRANDVLDEASFTFDEASSVPQRFSVDLVDPDRRAVSFTVISLLADGRQLTVPPSVTLGRRVIVREDMLGHRVVTIRPELVEFATRGVKQIRVDVRYQDEGEAISFADSFAFDGPEDVVNFEFDYVDPSLTDIEYRLTTFFTNGLSVDREWEFGSTDELTVPVGQT